jgi:phosphomethylpyrimidine synthase
MPISTPRAANAQMRFARNGEIAPVMQFVAQRESLNPALARAQVALGRLVIPANTHDLGGKLEPMGIGKVASVKIKANIGNSPASSSIDEEVGKLLLALKYGAETVLERAGLAESGSTRHAHAKGLLRLKH